MKFIAQHLAGEKKTPDILQFILTPETSDERALLGAANMLGIDSQGLEDDGSLSINFTAS